MNFLGDDGHSYSWMFTVVPHASLRWTSPGWENGFFYCTGSRGRNLPKIALHTDFNPHASRSISLEPPFPVSWIRHALHPVTECMSSMHSASSNILASAYTPVLRQNCYHAGLYMQYISRNLWSISPWHSENPQSSWLPVLVQGGVQLGHVGNEISTVIACLWYIGVCPPTERADNQITHCILGRLALSNPVIED